MNNYQKSTVVKNIIKNQGIANNKCGYAFAPSNIALCKYWGKRDSKLNLPFNSSLSIALGSKGAFTRIAPNNETEDKIYLNHKLISSDKNFAKKITSYLDLFRPFTKTYYTIDTTINLPVAAGLASSACGFAALIQALNNLHNWQLNTIQLSILARLGSGSACRSLWKGFVQWSAGVENDGMDSHGMQIECEWSELRIGLLILNDQEKNISSREAMQRTVDTVLNYSSWLNQANEDLLKLQQGIIAKDICLVGSIAESNALAMHRLMQQANPPINYSLLSTIQAHEQIQKLRTLGTKVYFTQDAGPNLKLLFLASATDEIRQTFPTIEIIAPFNNPQQEEVILVDKFDKALGTEEKWLAHVNGHLHRAFSIFILRRKNNLIEMLLQQRNSNKYHGANLWSNTCCSHPRPNEDIMSAAMRRLQEEMGFVTDLTLIENFSYTAKLTNGLIENEFDHLLIGFSSLDKFLTNKEEVQDYKWMDIESLNSDLINNPQNYTPWLPLALKVLKKKSVLK